MGQRVEKGERERERSNRDNSSLLLVARKMKNLYA